MRVGERRLSVLESKRDVSALLYGARLPSSDSLSACAARVMVRVRMMLIMFVDHNSLE